MKILMLGGTGCIGNSILSLGGNDDKYEFTVTSREERFSEYDNVKYIVGNANDLDFLNTIDDNSFDVLIDFMNYRNENLERNITKLIRIAKQYIFLSSARVYDNSQKYIDESCSLLLNTTDDLKFKDSGTYAVKKAWQENYVKKWAGNKVTIIRPYKTFSDERLQLGEYEIKHWLRRFINNKPIVLNKEMLSKYTSLTSGIDVAKGIISLFDKSCAYGETFQIATNDSMTWEAVLELYVDILTEKGYKPIVFLADNTEKIDALFECGYHMPYDIKFNRRFSSSKINKIQPINYKPMRDGLREALMKKLDNIDNMFYEPSEYDEVVDEFIENESLILWR